MRIRTEKEYEKIEQNYNDRQPEPTSGAGCIAVLLGLIIILSLILKFNN